MLFDNNNNNKGAPNLISTAMQTMDKDLVLQVLLSYLSLNPQFVAERMAVSSHVMLLRTIEKEKATGHYSDPKTADKDEQAHLSLFRRYKTSAEQGGEQH